MPGINIQTNVLGRQGNIIPAQLKCTSPILLASVGGSINLTENQNTSSQFIDSALSMYVDNGGNANPLLFTFSSGQQILVPANTQGYYNILQPNPIAFTCTGYAASGAYIMLINALMPMLNWTATAL